TVEFSLDGGTTWMTVIGETASFPIVVEGMTNILYRATDNAGNVSNVLPLVVRIDKTPPTADPQSIMMVKNKTRQITLTGSDVTSGVASIAAATQPSHGTLTGLGADVTYMPNPGYY